MGLISTYSNIYSFFSRLFPINKSSILLFLPSIWTINLNSTLLFLPSLLLLLQHSLCRLLSPINKQSRNQDCFTSTRSLIADHNQITFKRFDSSSPWNHLRKSRSASLRSNFVDPLLEFADHNQLLRWSTALFSSDYYMSECLKLIAQLKSPLLNKQSIEKLLLRSTETTRLSPLSKCATISDQQRQRD
jgi:hypothetical protein